MSEERYRLVVLGSPKVGKTSLIRRYLYHEFSEKYKETIEDIHIRQFLIQKVPLPLEILDTNFNFPDMRKVAIASASAFLLVFSVDDVQSFKQMSELWTEISERRNDVRTLPTVVVGNKSDLSSKKIFEATATAWTSRLNCDIRYIETSAKTGVNVVAVFKNLLEISGFPRCKAAGGALHDPDDVAEESIETSGYSQQHHGKNTKTSTISNADISGELLTHQRQRQSSGSSRQSQQPSLSIPRTIGEFRRNRSFRIKSGEDTQTDGDPKSLSRSHSLIRRTKHLSLKLRRHGDKAPEELDADESDCKIS